MLTASPDLTDTYDGILTLSTALAARTVQRRMDSIKGHDFTAAWRAISTELSGAIIGSQAASVTASRWYLEETIRSTTGIMPSLLEVSSLVGQTSSGMSIERYLARTPEIVAVRVANGMDTDLAIAMSQRAVMGLATTEAYRVGRAAVAETTTADDNFVGWRRQPEAGACSFCLMLAGRGLVYTSRATAEQTSKALSYHKRCKCRGVGVTSFDRVAANAAATQQWADIERPTIYRTGTRSDGRRRQPTRPRPAPAAQQVTQPGQPPAMTGDFYTDAPSFRPGAKTPQRRASVSSQIEQISERLAQMEAMQDPALAKAVAWNTKRLAALRAELAALT